MIKLPPDLRVTNSLSLDGVSQEFFQPFARQIVTLAAGKGSSIMGMVNAAATSLYSAKLWAFLSQFKTNWVSVYHEESNLFIVRAVKGRPDNSMLAGKMPPVTVPSSDTGLPKPERLNGNQSEHPVKQAETKKPVQPVPGQNPSSERNVATTSGRTMRLASSFPAQKGGAPSAAQKVDTPSPAKRVDTPSPAKKVDMPPAKMIGKPLPANKYGTSPPAKKNNPPATPVATARKSPVLLSRDSGSLRSDKNSPPFEKNEISFTNGKSPGEFVTAQPELPPAAGGQTSAAIPPVRVNFFPVEDAAVLGRITTGEATPVADLYLRRQALRLSLSPGFETLLSLSAVRWIQPLDYQLRTVRHVLTNLRGRALLCDEVGMGKTVEAGLILTEYLLRGLVRRVLVLAPPSLVEQWQEEMQSKFNLDFMVYDSPQFKAHANPWQGFPRIIASIDTAKRDSKREQVLAAEYDLVIVDEAHHLKNDRSLGYQLVGNLKKKYILLLTATPVENDLEELFNLITLLLPGQLETAASFKRKYITKGDPLKPKNTLQLKRLIQEVMVRNRRSETGAIAGRRSAEVVDIQLTGEEMAFYRRLTTFVRGYYGSGGDKPQAGVSRFVLKVLQREAGSSMEAVLATLTKMAADSAYPDALRRVFTALSTQAKAVPRRAKVDALLKILGRLEGKVIIFTGFTETQRYLATRLGEAGWTVAELHSGLRRQEKEEQVRLFSGDVHILVSTETGSEGRNLQFCHQMINFDLPWNPMRIEQRIGRIHRLGQDHDVQIYNLAAAGTIEAHILDILDAKINMFQLVVGELDMILGNLKEKRDFEDLLMDIWAGSPDDAVVQAQMDDLGNRLVGARDHYLAVKALDDRLLSELTPEE